MSGFDLPPPPPYSQPSAIQMRGSSTMTPTLTRTDERIGEVAIPALHLGPDCEAAAAPPTSLDGREVSQMVLPESIPIPVPDETGKEAEERFAQEAQGDIADDFGDEERKINVDNNIELKATQTLGITSLTEQSTIPPSMPVFDMKQDGQIKTTDTRSSENASIGAFAPHSSIEGTLDPVSPPVMNPTIEHTAIERKSSPLHKSVKSSPRTDSSTNPIEEFKRKMAIISEKVGGEVSEIANNDFITLCEQFGITKADLERRLTRSEKQTIMIGNRPVDIYKDKFGNILEVNLENFNKEEQNDVEDFLLQEGHIRNKNELKNAKFSYGSEHENLEKKLNELFTEYNRFLEKLIAKFMSQKKEHPTENGQDDFCTHKTFKIEPSSKTAPTEIIDEFKKELNLTFLRLLRFLKQKDQEQRSTQERIKQDNQFAKEKIETSEARGTRLSRFEKEDQEKERLQHDIHLQNAMIKVHRVFKLQKTTYNTSGRGLPSFNSVKN